MAIGLFASLCRFEPDDPEGRARYWRRECHDLLKHGRPMPSKRQAECLEIIKAYIKREGQPPTYREIAAKMGTTTAAGVFCFVVGLEERGWIIKAPGKTRSITVVDFPSHNNVDNSK